MAQNRWSRDDPCDPLSWHLRENLTDPLAAEFLDSFVLVSRRYAKDLIARAVSRSNEDVWSAVNAHSEKINHMEIHMSDIDDALAEADTITNEIAEDLDALAAQLKGKDQAVAEKIRAHSAKLRGVANKYPEVESDEPPADGEPFPPSDPQTVPVTGGDPIPVSNFPAETPSGEDATPADGEPVPASDPQTDENKS